MGNFAKNKKNLIDLNNNHIVEANHPSPLSANRGGFFGSKIFTKTKMPKIARIALNKLAIFRVLNKKRLT